MKSATAPMIAHLGGNVLTVTWCLKVTRTDGVIKRVTNHDQDIVIPSDGTYLAAVGYDPSAIEKASDMSVDNLELSGIFATLGVSEQDGRNGLYDNADVQVFLVNWADPSLTMGNIRLNTGVLGELTLMDWFYRTDLLGLVKKLQTRIGRVYLPMCDADLGDDRCTVDLTPFTESGEVESIISSKRKFVAVTGLTATDEWFNFGVITWLTGNNAGTRIEVKDWDGATRTFTLDLATIYPIVPGDTFDVYAGCSKLLTGTHGCKTKFNNVVNFRGHPYIQGNDFLTRYPDNKTA